MIYYLYWDMSDENDDSYTKLVRARYASLSDAKAQAVSYIEQGYRVVCIEKSKGRLGGASRETWERGEEVWKP